MSNLAPRLYYLWPVVLAVFEALGQSEDLVQTEDLLFERLDVLLPEAATVGLEQQVETLRGASRLPLRPGGGKGGCHADVS